GIDRNANATVPRCWYTLVRNRPTPGTPIAKSASLCSANSLTCRGVMICSASDFNSSGLSGAVSSESSSPFTRIVAGRPTLSNRSDALRWTIWVMACLKLNVAPLGASGMRIHAEEGLSELDRLSVFHADFAHQPRDFGLDLVHDLHRLDDADDLPGGDPTPRLDIGRRPRLGCRVERPDHRGLDLHELRLSRDTRRGDAGLGAGSARGYRTARRLVTHEHLPVPEQGAEHLAEAARFDHVPRKRVRAAPAHAPPHTRARPPLRLGHELVHSPLPLRGPRAHHDSARDVGAVAVY